MAFLWLERTVGSHNLQHVVHKQGEKRLKIERVLKNLMKYRKRKIMYTALFNKLEQFGNMQ